MKIVAFTTKLNFRNAGGSVDETDLIFRTLQQTGHELKAVTTFSSANDIPRFPSYKISYEQITSGSILGIMWQSYKLLKKYETDADVFYVDGQVFLYGAGLYRQLGGKAPIAAFFNRELSVWAEYASTFYGTGGHHWLKKIKKDFRWIIEKYMGMPIASKIDLLAFTCPPLREVYSNFGLKTGDKSIIIGDPIDYKKIMAEHDLTETAYRQRNKHAGPYVLFYSGRMVPGKGFDFLLKAFANLRDKKQFHLILGGDGPEKTHLQQLAKDLAIDSRVEFTGWLPKDQVYKILGRTDVFIHACWRTELSSMILVEAMAFGVPGVLPGGGGIEWVAKNSAIYYKAADYHDMAQKIEKLSQDFELRVSLSRQCYARLAEDELNHEKNIAELAGRMEGLVVK